MCWCAVCWRVGVLLCWCAGVLVWLCADVLVCWCDYVLMYWCADVLMCWCADVLMFWCADMLKCWCADILICWCAGVLMCWCVDVLYADMPMCWWADVQVCWCAEVHQVEGTKAKKRSYLVITVMLQSSQAHNVWKKHVNSNMRRVKFCIFVLRFKVSKIYFIYKISLPDGVTILGAFYEVANTTLYVYITLCVYHISPFDQCFGVILATIVCFRLLWNFAKTTLQNLSRKLKFPGKRLLDSH